MVQPELKEIETEALILMRHVSDRMGYADYCVWLATLNPPLDECPYPQILRVLRAKMDELTRVIEVRAPDLRPGMGREEER